MTSLYYITHPDVDIHPNIPVDQWLVSDEGWKHVDHLIKSPSWKDINVIYSSQEPKALRVAEDIESRIQHLRMPNRLGYSGLGEINRSSTGYLLPEEYQKATEEFYSHPNESYKGWETAIQATERTMFIVSQIMEEEKGKTVAIVGHGCVGTLLVCALKKITSTIDEDPKKTGCVVHIDWERQKVLSPWIPY